MALAEQMSGRPARQRGRADPAPGPAAAGDSRLFWAVPIVLLALLVPLNVFAGPLVLTTQRVVLMVAIFPVAMRFISGDYGRIRFIDWAIFLYLLWATLTIGINNPAAVVQYSGSTSLELLGGYLIGRCCIRNIHQFRRMARLFAGLVLLSLPFALYEGITGQSLLLRVYNGLPVVFSAREITTAPRLGLYRAQFTMPTPIHYGLFAALALCLVTVAHQNLWGLAKRLVVGGAIFLCSFLSLSSGAFLAVVFQIGFLAWARMTRGITIRWWILFAIAAVFYTVIEVFSDRSGIMVFLSYATFSAATAFNRVLIFNYGMDNVWANPLFGIGLNDWVRPFWMIHPSVDNFWLLNTMRHGLPSFLLMSVAWLGQIWIVAKRPLTEGSDLYWARRAWLFTIVSMTFTLCTVDVWGPPFVLCFFLFGAGAWLMDAAEPEDAAAAEPVQEGPADRPGRDRTEPPSRRRQTLSRNRRDAAPEESPDDGPEQSSPEAGTTDTPVRRRAPYARPPGDRRPRRG